MIHTVWYHYEDNALYIWTDKHSRKARNMVAKNRVYFSVDTDSAPYKGVKGKGTASTFEVSTRAIEIAKKMVIKYMGNLDNEYGRMLLEAKPGPWKIIEIVPDYYSVWDYSK